MVTVKGEQTIGEEGEKIRRGENTMIGERD